MNQLANNNSAFAMEFIAGVAGGYPEEQRREMLAEALIDSHRRRVALDAPCQPCAPSAEVLRSKGFDLVKVADAMAVGLNSAQFGMAVDCGFSPALFHSMVESSGLTVKGVTRINAVVLQHLETEDPDLVKLHPHPSDRAMHVQRTCRCFAR